MSALKSFQPVVLSVLRIVTAYLFLLHGTAKFFSFPMSRRRAWRLDAGGCIFEIMAVSIDIGPVHPSGRVCFIRSDGSRLLYGTRVFW